MPPKPIDLSAGPIMDGWYPIDFELSASETKAKTKIRISLDPGRLILPKSIPKEKTEIEIDPKWNQANPITVYLYGIGYNYAGLPTPTYPDPTYLNQIRDQLQTQIKDMLPVPWQNSDGSSAINVTVLDARSRYCWDETGVYPFYTDSAAVMAPQCRINQGAPTSDAFSPFVDSAANGQWLPVAKGFMLGLKTLEPSQFSEGLRPQNTYFMGVMQRLPSHSDAKDLGGVTYPDWYQGSPTYLHGHSSVLLTPDPSLGSNPFLGIHELGHQLQVLHAPFPSTVG